MTKKIMQEDKYENWDDELIEDSQNEYQVKSEDFSKKEGKYVFTVGNVSSGKSTLQNLLIYRLWSHENIKFEYGRNNSDHRHNAILNSWVESFKNGVLPGRTKKGTIQEFNISIGQKGKQDLDVNFIEISGEDIKSIIPSVKSENKPSVHNQLDRYVSEDNGINKRFIFVSNGEDHKKGMNSNSNVSEDILFNTFLRYLLSDTQKGLRKINILFVIAKWDTVRADYNNDYKKYMKANFPQTLSILNDSNRVSVMFLPFTVGRIEEQLVDEDNHIYENRIMALDKIYVDRLIQWIYNTFTGETLTGLPPIKPSFLYRIAKIFGIR